MNAVTQALHSFLSNSGIGASHLVSSSSLSGHVGSQLTLMAPLRGVLAQGRWSGCWCMWNHHHSLVPRPIPSAHTCCGVWAWDCHLFVEIQLWHWILEEPVGHPLLWNVVLGPRIWGDIWSWGTAVPPTAVYLASRNKYATHVYGIAVIFLHSLPTPVGVGVRTKCIIMGSWPDSSPQMIVWLHETCSFICCVSCLFIIGGEYFRTLSFPSNSVLWQLNPPHPSD